MAYRIYVETDPLFTVALSTLSALNNSQQMDAVGISTVTNINIVNPHSLSEWRNGYDFARTAGVTLRAFFLRAINLTALGVNDPVTQSTPPNLANGLTINQVPQGFPTIVTTVQEGEELYARYDQMMPHYIIQEAIRNATGNGGHFSRSCIIYTNHGTERFVYHVVSNLTWNRAVPVNATINNPVAISDPKGQVMVVGAKIKPTAREKVARWRRMLTLMEDDADELDELENAFDNFRISVEKDLHERRDENSA